MRIKKLFLLFIIATLVLSLGVNAYSPSSNSPMARGEHPRIFFSSNELPALRDRIATYYKTEFQDFINMLNNPSSLTSNQKTIENNWGSMNYAFLAVLDPQQMQQKGFTFSSSFDTPQEYCAKAMSYAKTQLSSISSATGQGHGDLDTGYPTPIYFPVIATYDWCYPYLSSTDKQAIVDAFVAAYNKKWKGVDSLRAYGRSQMIANNQDTADIHETLGIVAFYNDPYPGSTLQTEMFDVFYNVWINRILTEINHFYKRGTGWHEGGGPYLADSYLNAGIPIAMFSSAMGTDYATTMPFFYKFPLFVQFNIKPSSTLSQCGSGSSRCPEIMERWGTIGDNLGFGCKPALLNSGQLRKSNHPYAPLAKWTYQNTIAGGCATALTNYGGTWSNAVLHWFIYGDKEVNAQSPTQANTAKTQEFGFGEYIMKSGFEGTDSQVVFWTPENEAYGHASQEDGAFSIHKFGNLVLNRAGNSKSGDAVISSSKFNLMSNSIGIHKGSSDQGLGFNGGAVDPFWQSRGTTTIKSVGKVLAENINSGLYDYVVYDNTLSWAPSTSDLSQREFVYIRGPLNKEFVVVFDRMNVPNPSSDEKIWKIWVPNQPNFENGSPTNPRTGKWTSSNSDTISMTNQFPRMTTPKIEFAPTHGKFYMKTLAPTNAVINFLGGPGKEYQSGNDDGSTPWGSPSMTQGMHEYLGWGRIEVRPATSQNYDTFFNVIQFGDSNSLNSMSPTARIDSSSGNMIGVHIQDSSNQWAVMFVKNAANFGNINSVSYSLSGTGTVNHLVTGLKKNTNYDIYDNGAKILTKASNSGGVLYFTSNLGSTHTFSLTAAGGVVDTTNPTVSITSPSNNAQVSGTITINANANDNMAVAGVQLKVDNSLIVDDISFPYSTTLDTKTLSNGQHAITATARDTSENTATATINVNVNNANLPTVSITSPLNNAFFTAPVAITINANAADSDGTVSKVEFFANNNLIGTDTTMPYSFTWSNVVAGTYSLTAKAVDSSGLSTTSNAVQVTVNAQGIPPTFSITNPTNNAIISGSTVNVNYASSGDLTGAAHVHLQLDNNPEIRGLSFSGLHQFTNVPAGSHTVRGYIARADHSKIGNEATATVTMSISQLAGDINNDNKVNILDILVIVKDYGKTFGFNPKADLNNDNRINILDILVVVRNLGKIS